MARPKKDDAEFFGHDKHMRNDEKVKALRRKFSYKGYALWCMLLEKLTDSPHFKLSYKTEIDKDLLAGDFDIEVSELDAVIEYMQKIRLIENQDGIIYSQKLIARFKSLLDRREYDRKRKDSDSFPHGKPSENNVNQSENDGKTRVIHVEKSQHSIEKKSILNNIPLPFGDDFRIAWTEWLQYRSEAKKKVTPSTAKRQLERLSRLPERQAIEMIQQSIQNGWTGLFEVTKPTAYKTMAASVGGFTRGKVA